MTWCVIKVFVFFVYCIWSCQETYFYKRVEFLIVNYYKKYKFKNKSSENELKINKKNMCIIWERFINDEKYAYCV